MFLMAELNKGLLLIPQYSNSQIYLQLPGCKSEKQKGTEQRYSSAIEPLHFERNKFERSLDCISCI